MVTQTERAEYIRRAKEIYADKLLPRYIDTHKGRYIVVDGRSGDHEVAGNWDVGAFQRLKRRRPEAITFSIRVGMSSAGDAVSAYIDPR